MKKVGLPGLDDDDAPNPPASPSPSASDAGSNAEWGCSPLHSSLSGGDTDVSTDEANDDDDDDDGDIGEIAHHEEVWKGRSYLEGIIESATSCLSL